MTLVASGIVESRRLYNKKILGIYILFLILSLYFVQIGINQYKSITDNKQRFLDLEKMKVKQYQTIGQYGTYGFRVLFIPSPLSLFFANSSTISQLTSNVDSGERLNIYNSFKGQSIFAEKVGGFKDFSGMQLLLGSLLILFFGYEALIHKDYLRFTIGYVSYQRLYFSIIFFRMITFIFLFLLTSSLSLILIKLNGIDFFNDDWIKLGIYLATVILLLTFFFFLGTIVGSFRSRLTGFAMAFISWFGLVFFIPGVVSAITSSQADNIISDYYMELEKLKLLMEVEKRTKKNVAESPNKDEEVLRQMENYWNHEFKEIQAFEKRMEGEMKKNIRLFQKLSFLFPSTFYLSTSDEISSKGYENFIMFFNYLQQLKTRFVRYYLDKKYNLSPPPSHPEATSPNIEPFTKNQENLFYAQSRLPQGFFIGLSLNLLYIAVLVLVSFFRFKHSLRL